MKPKDSLGILEDICKKVAGIYGYPLKKCSDKISDEMTKKMYEGFSEEEIDKFEEYLHRIIKNFEEKRKVISDDKSIDKIIDRRF